MAAWLQGGAHLNIFHGELESSGEQDESRKPDIDRPSIGGHICASVRPTSNMLTPQSSMESVCSEEPGPVPTRAASSWSLLRHRVRSGGHYKSSGGAQLSSLIKLAGQERSKRSAQSLKESQSVLTVEIQRLRERVGHLETQLAANQSVVSQTQQQLEQLFHQVQHIDAQLRHWPLDGTALQPLGERRRHEFLLSQVLDQIRNGNYRLHRVSVEGGKKVPHRGATIGDPKINKCPLVQEIEAVRVAMKKKTSACSADAEESENSKEADTGRSDAGRLATERHLPPPAPFKTGAINIKKHIQRTFDSRRL